MERITGRPERILPARYRLRPRRFKFRLLDGKLVEVHTGLPAHSTARSWTFGRQPPPPSERPSDHLYLNNDGSPADEWSEFLLRRDMMNDLCVLLCRLTPEPVFGDGSGNECSISESQRFENLLRQEGMPANLPPVGVTIGTSAELEKLHAKRYSDLRNQRTEVVPARSVRRRRSFAGLSRAEWHRAVVKRISLFFGRPSSDPLIQRLADYFRNAQLCNQWTSDPRLEPLREYHAQDQQLQRLMLLIEAYAEWREDVAARNTVPREFTRLDLGPSSRTFTFAFPLTNGRRRGLTERQRHIRACLFDLALYVGSPRWYHDRWLAASVWLGREFLESPKHLARRRLTQHEVAHLFRITRQQLVYAVKRAQEPDFAQPFWDHLRACRLLKK